MLSHTINHRFGCAVRCGDTTLIFHKLRGEVTFIISMRENGEDHDFVSEEIFLEAERVARLALKDSTARYIPIRVLLARYREDKEALIRMGRRGNEVQARMREERNKPFRIVTRKGHRLYWCTVRSEVECDVKWDDITMTFKKRGRGLIDTNRTRSSGGEVGYLKPPVYEAARDVANAAIAEFAHTQPAAQGVLQLMHG